MICVSVLCHVQELERQQQLIDMPRKDNILVDCRAAIVLGILDGIF